ncbi:hypothetical protein C7C46_04815 [Streptomyces tateyamensis]|uniref:JmjC domain-containing protein n=1 Tax=Streptomyces tateyamensis TaxID=565073 RepID=A0A2V4NYZ1_9ACTN|nr:hypothetical protein [Streptomyces tateyamensis]PYC87405.1 hypothetical protein C7C46_04815 [Streptomyces tateyamensis]
MNSAQATGPDAGWEVGSFWETRPTVLARRDREPAFTEDALFELACAASAQRATLPDPQDVRVFADESMVNPSMVQAYLPTREGDGSFAGYARRLRATAGSFALTINSLQQFDWELFRALRRQVDPVLDALAHPTAGGVDCHLIASVYGTAPTLVHKDTAGVFTYVVSGFKRFYTWPFEVFGELAGPEAMQRQVNLPASIRHHDHLATATVVEGGPGTVLYWPSDRWHCATSDGTFALSLHIAHYQWDDRLALLIRRLQALAAGELGTTRFEGGPLGAGSGEVDSRIRKTVTALLDGPELELELKLRQLKRRTASNFEVLPRLREAAEPAPADRLTVTADSVLRTLRADGTTHLAANGHLLRARGGDWLDAFLPALTPGTTRTPADWCALARAAGGPQDDRQLTALLAELVKRGALDHERASA